MEVLILVSQKDIPQLQAVFDDGRTRTKFSSPPSKHTSRGSQLGMALPLVDAALQVKKIVFRNPNVILWRLKDTLNVVELYKEIGK